jgi:hypothetical protein
MAKVLTTLLARNLFERPIYRVGMRQLKEGTCRPRVESRSC